MGALVSRRNFLIASLATGAVLATAGFTARLAPAAPGALVLSARELRIVEAIAETIFPRDPMPLDGREAQVALGVDRELAELLDQKRLAAIRYVLRAIEMGTQASRGVRFTELDLEARMEVLDAWADPRVLPRRVGLDAVKVFLAMSYFRHPAVLEHIGWRQACGGAAT